MKVETETIKNEIFTNDEETHRYLLQRRWGEPNTAIVAVITLKPGSASPLHNDLTTMLIQNHVAEMGYKGFVAINLVSGISSSNKVTESLSDKEIEDELLKEVLNKKEVQQVIVTCGSSISKKGFPQDRLKDILTNMFYIGMIQGGQFGSYKGKHIPIIDQELFDSAQNIRLSKNSLVGVQTMFKLRKKLSCPNCKSILTPNKQTRENKDYFYYVCPSCKKFSISASYLEKESCRLMKNYVLEGKQFKLLMNNRC